MRTMIYSKDAASMGRRGFRRDSGQSLLEVALLTPFLLLLLLGTIEMGRYAFEGIELGNAARAGVAYGAQNHFTAADPNGITDAACQDFQGTNACGLTVTPAYLCQCDNAGTVSTLSNCTQTCPVGTHEVVSLQVTASDKFTPVFKYPGIPSQVTVNRTATMRIWQ
jgi:Flp pilus assembly protein TadG